VAAFEFHALDDAGKKKKGVIEAENERHLRNKLRDRGLLLIQCKESKESLSVNWFSPKMTVKERALITRQLATLIEAGFPIEEALSGVAKQSKKRKIVSILLSVRSKVLEGNTLAASLSIYPKAFPNLYRASIKAGEESGHLPEVLTELANFNERVRGNEQKLHMAMLYPAILTLVAISIISFLLTSVMPEIVSTFQKQNAKLPSITIMMLAVSDGISAYGRFGVLLMVVLFILYALLMKKERFQLLRDRCIFNLPVLSSMVKTIQITRYISTLAMLTHSGVPLVDAMNIAVQVTDNRVIKAKLSEASQQVKEGTALWKALDESQLIPPMMLQLVINGEQSGQLDAMLMKAARQQEDDTNNWISTIVGLFEPAMLLVMGAFVMMIVSAILLPIMNLNQLLQ
jgi:general secretion pathway protein F